MKSAVFEFSWRSWPVIIAKISGEGFVSTFHHWGLIIIGKKMVFLFVIVMLLPSLCRVLPPNSYRDCDGRYGGLWQEAIDIIEAPREIWKSHRSAISGTGHGIHGFGSSNWRLQQGTWPAVEIGDNRNSSTLWLRPWMPASLLTRTRLFPWKTQQATAPRISTDRVLQNQRFPYQHLVVLDVWNHHLRIVPYCALFKQYISCCWNQLA